MPDPAAALASDRVAIARRLIEFGRGEEDLLPAVSPAEAAVRAAASRRLALPWPAGLAPTPTELEGPPDPEAPLPKADYLVVTWTVAELEALADVLTPGFARRLWYPYSRLFEERYRPQIRGGAPSLSVGRLGSYFATRIGNASVVCVKSELHLNQDGKPTDEGTATLPVADLFRQLIEEVEPRLVISVGTAGATHPDHELGDVIITRAAQFRLTQEFRNEAFSEQSYRCEFELPESQLAAAGELLAVNAERLAEPAFAPPTKLYEFPGAPVPGPRNAPDLKLDGRDFPAFQPMLTTDYFEFGTSTNQLEEHGCGVEMGDPVLGMIAEELGEDSPRWLVVRNVSDPQINGELPTDPVDMQVHWAVWYYETYGYWTSVNSAIATWAMIAGDAQGA